MDAGGSGISFIEYLQKELLSFYTEYGRTFPWRDTRDPYRIMIAEFMLQRTRANQVVPVYNHFLEKYPDVFSLSRACLEDIKDLLYSLGLHWRAHYFIKAARYIVDKLNGVFPSEREKLIQIPGVGNYVAGVILVVAYNRPEYVIDSNIARFINRFFGLELKGEIRRKRKVKEISKKMFLNDNPKKILFSVLDFTSLVCIPQKPKCGICYLISNCKFKQKSFE